MDPFCGNPCLEYDISGNYACVECQIVAAELEEGFCEGD